MPAKEFKNVTLNVDGDDKGHKRCYCYVPVSSIPAHLRNYIVAVEETPSIEKIAEWMDSAPQKFHLLAPKVVLHTEKFVFDNRKNKLSFELENIEYQGVICGANTLLAVLGNRKEHSSNTPDGEVYIELELLKGLSKEEVDMVSAADCISPFRYLSAYL